MSRDTVSRCPDEEALAVFAAGACDPATSATIDAHVADCSICAAWLEQARTDEDYLLDVRAAVEADSTWTDRVAGYRVLRKLGEGGMGVVYEAEQDSPRRSVALKIVRHAFPSQRMLPRFEHEAELLGRLQHGGIAQIFEAGTFDSGHGEQPFFAMELVHGEPLLARARSLSVTERLRLLAAICDAVQHAHQKGVIHRDLKPSNILVDRTGQPKVLDFGIARELGEAAAERSFATRSGQLVGTVPYMSPEQLAGDPHDVDVRADVYALGVILFEMLTGQLPHDVTDLGIAEQARAITEGEPRSLGAVDPSLRGDLETIARTALAPDRDRRYVSAADLAADLRRFLADEPIAARRPSTVYQLRKFAKRNKALVGGVLGVFVALTVGLLATLQHKRQAEEQLAQAVAARDFLQEVLVQASPTENQGEEPTIRAALEIALQRVDRDLIDQPVVAAAVRHTLGKVLHGLGDLAEARDQLERSLRGYEAVYGEHPQIVYVLADLAGVLRRQGDLRESERLARRAIDMRHVLTPAHDFILARTVDSLGIAYLTAGKAADAERCFREAIAVCQRFDDADQREINVALMSAHRAAALAALAKTDETDAAERLYRSSIETLRERLGDRSPLLATQLSNFARLRRDQGDLAEAEALLVESLAIRQGLPGTRDAAVAADRVALGGVLFAAQRRDEGLRLARDGLATLRADVGVRHPHVASALMTLARMRSDGGDPQEARALLEEALAIADERLGADHRLTRKARERLDRLEASRPGRSPPTHAADK